VCVIGYSQSFSSNYIFPRLSGAVSDWLAKLFKLFLELQETSFFSAA